MPTNVLEEARMVDRAGLIADRDSFRAASGARQHNPPLGCNLHIRDTTGVRSYHMMGPQSKPSCIIFLTAIAMPGSEFKLHS
jgi:hypothetical protein